MKNPNDMSITGPHARTQSQRLMPARKQHLVFGVYDERAIFVSFVVPGSPLVYVYAGVACVACACPWPESETIYPISQDFSAAING